MSSENLLLQIVRFPTMMNNQDNAIYRNDLAGYIQIIKFRSFYGTNNFIMKEKGFKGISNKNFLKLRYGYTSHIHRESDKHQEEKIKFTVTVTIMVFSIFAL